MLKIDEYKLKIKKLRELLSETASSLNIDELRERLSVVRAELEKPEVWGDLTKSQKFAKEATIIESKVSTYDKALSALKDALDLAEMLEL